MIRTSGFFPWVRVGNIQLPTYFFVISITLSLAAFWIDRRARRDSRNARLALDLYLLTLIGGFLGSRLLHILWEEPAYYFEYPLRVFDVLAGGFVWYGGLIGGFFGLWLGAKFRARQPLKPWLDFFSPVAAFGYAGGRVACALTGCCFGRVCDWPVVHQAPSQFFAAVWEAGVGLLLLRFERRPRRPGFVLACWLGLHGLGRALMEIIRGDDRGPTVLVAFFTLGFLISIGLMVGAIIWLKLVGMKRDLSANSSAARR